LVRDGDVDALMKVRVERQTILARRDNPVRFWAVIGEAALRTPIGGPEVMSAQLDYLRAVVERPNVTLQVLPYSVGAHAGLSGPFVLFSFAVANDTGVVFLENLTSSLYLEMSDEVAGYTLVFDALRSAALNPADSFDYIATVGGEALPVRDSKDPEGAALRVLR
jgi:hypothetical protein